MSGNRITPEMVLEAFKVTGLVPVQDEYAGNTSDGRRCVCGLSVVYIHQVGAEGFERLRNEHEDDLLIENLKIESRYLTGFMNGFDGGKMYPHLDQQGYEDGKAAWEAVKHLAVSQ